MAVMTNTQRELMPEIAKMLPQLSDFNQGYIFGLVARFEQENSMPPERSGNTPRDTDNEGRKVS